MKAENVEILTPGRKPLDRSQLQRFDGENDPWFFGLRVLALHVYPESRNFRVGADFSDYRGDGVTGRLEISCLNARDCVAPRSVVHPAIAIELTAAATIAFHSEHEGHPIELKWNGEIIHPR